MGSMDVMDTAALYASNWDIGEAESYGDGQEAAANLGACTHWRLPRSAVSTDVRPHLVIAMKLTMFVRHDHRLSKLRQYA